MEDITVCPSCEKSIFIIKLNCKDYTVSQERFTLKECNNCGFLLTSPRPTSETLGNYYISDDYISHTATAKTVMDKIYLLVRKFTLNKKLKLINRYAQNPEKLLDYGCGTGEFLKKTSDNGWTIHGVEPSNSARKKAAHLTGLEIKAELTDVEPKFKVITLWHVLEHIPTLDNTLLKLKQVLKNDGILFIAVPNHKSYDAMYYKQFWAGYDVPRHLWHFSQNTMNNVLKKHSLKIVETIPMKFDSYYVSMLSEKYKAGKSSIPGMLTAVMTGFKSNIRAKKTNDYSSLIYVIKK